MPEHSEAQYFALLRSGKPFFYLRRRASPALVEAVNALGEPGLAIQREPDRLYPQTTPRRARPRLYRHRRPRRRRRGARVRPATCPIPATRGTPLMLSIDSRVQQALEHELSDAMTTFSAIGAAGVVMDVHTGEVLAMTSLPEINPNAPGAAHARRSCSTAPRSGVYELGSTFKPFTVAMAMDCGVDQGSGQQYNCPDVAAGLRPSGPRHPPVRARSARSPRSWMESSNIGTAQIADQLGTARQKAWLKKMGFLDQVRDRAQGARPAADPGRALGAVRDHDHRLRPGHRGRAAAAGDGLCDPVRRRHLSSADDPQGRPRPPASARASACSPRTPATACARCCGWS